MGRLSERGREGERERFRGPVVTVHVDHLAPPVVYASLAAVVTSVPLTMLRIEHCCAPLPTRRRLVYDL